MTTAWRSGNQANSRTARRGEQAADADAEERRQQDEVREIRQQPDVRRHPADERDLQEQDEERREEDADAAGNRTDISCWRVAVTPSLFSASSGQPFHSGTITLPMYCRSVDAHLAREEPGGGEVAEAVEEGDAVREFRLRLLRPGDVVEDGGALLRGAGEEPLVEAVLALEVDPGQAAAHRRLPRRARPPS